jgi:hypothetical protein
MGKRRKKSRNLFGQNTLEDKPHLGLLDKQSSGRSLALTRIVWALNLIIGVLRALQTIPLSYHWTVALIYCLFGVSLIELFREPSLKGWPRNLGATLVVIVAVWFTVVSPLSKAPLEALAYTTPGDHPAGTVIGDISWNSHFTDLRVAITNSSPDDYHHLNMLLKPDVWTYRATMAEPSSDCELIRVEGQTDMRAVSNGKGGATEIKLVFNGTGYEAYDNAGDIFTTFASEGGYTLRCTNFPSKYTVHLAFALVDISPFSSHPNGLLQETYGNVGMRGGKNETMKFTEVSSPNPLDVLGPKPSPKKLSLSGSYSKGVKPYSISGNTEVNGQETHF